MKGVIYARYSSDNQREESIEGQLRENKAFAEKNGIEIIETYIDRAFSAKTDNRPEFQRMIKESARKSYDVVIVWKLDRFARNRTDSAMYKAILRKNGKKVISATEAISEGADGIILEAVLEGMAEYYSADLSEKIKRGMTENALKCKNNGCIIPFGYKINEERRYEVVEELIPTVQDIFQRFARGERIKTILDRLNDAGLKTTRGMPFTYNSIHSMLRNRLYIGEYHYADISIPDGAPRIISDELFEAVAKRIETNKRRPAASKAREKYILSGKLFCGQCMSMMDGESCNKKSGVIYRYYKCHSAKKGRGCHKKPVRKEWIETLVVERLLNELLKDGVINRLVEEQYALLNKEDGMLPSLRAQLDDVRKRIKNIIRAIEEGRAAKSVTERLFELEEEESKLMESIAAKEAPAPTISKETMFAILNRVRSLDMTLEENREWLVDCFIKCIILYDDRIVITTGVSDEEIEIPTKEDAEAVIASSDLVNTAPPNEKAALVAAFFV